MRVGDETHRWVEGSVLLFDDSFEHEVWNETDSPRLVLIIDLWHPLLDTDQKRLATLDPERATRYTRITKSRIFESAAQPAPQHGCRFRASDVKTSRPETGSW